jgi:hypothetical protein
MHLALSDQTLATQEIAPASASSGAKNGAGVDMQGWEGVAFHISIGAITGAGVADARVTEDDNSGFNSQTNITNAALTQIPAANANTLHIIDVYRPSQRYVRCVLTPADNTVVYAVTAVRYRRAGLLPPTQAANQTVKVAAN